MTAVRGQMSEVSKSLVLSPSPLALSFLTALLFTLSPVAEAQEPTKLYRVGRLSGGSPAESFSKDTFDAFRQGLRDLGWVEGRNIALEPRWAAAKPETLGDLAAELVRLRVDVIVAVGATVVQAAKQATTTIPIVMAGAGTDPVAARFIASLARPGGNITGLSLLSAELDTKRLELLKEVVPGLGRVVVLQNPDFPQAPTRWKEMEAAGKLLGIQLQAWEVRRPEDIDSVFSGTVRPRPSAVLLFSDPVILDRNQQRTIALALKNRLPAIYPWRYYVEDGGLMAYAPNLLDAHRRSAYFVDKILKGAKPADLPVEQPTKFELVINLNAAKQIGLTIPPNVLARADKVIR
jgi:putative ABC transport system substrate-binding protein